MSEPKWLELARAELGVAEIVGPEDNPRVLAYYADAGHPEVKHDEVAWCAAFAGAMLKRSGKPTPPKNVSLLARSYETYGSKLAEPRVGCLAVFPRGAAWQGHVGFVAGVHGSGNIDLLAGNQGNRVSIVLCASKDAVAFVWPPE